MRLVSSALSFSLLLLAMQISCKPSATNSDTKAITGLDDDGKRKAFTMVPIKPEGFTSPVTVASLAVVECGEMAGLPPEVTIRTIELLGAVGQLFYNGKNLTIPKSAGLKMQAKGSKELHTDLKDNLPVLKCSIIGDPVPYEYAEVAHASNQLAQKFRGAKDFAKIKDEYLVAQTIFLAMRGATELDDQGRPTSIDGAPLLAQLEIMSGTDAKVMARQIASQDAVFNPCVKSSSEGTGVLKGTKAKYKYFSCGKTFKAAGKSFRHYEVGGDDNAYSYATIKKRLVEKLAESRVAVAKAKGRSLTGDAPAAAAFALQDGGTSVPAPGPGQAAPQPTATQPAAQPAAAPSSTAAAGGFEPALQVLPANFENKNLYKGVIKDNVTGDQFARTNDGNTIFKVNQIENGYATTQQFDSAGKTSDGNVWIDKKSGDQVKINAGANVMQQWDKDGNLKNGEPGPYQFNFKPGSGKDGDNGTFQFMKDGKAIGPAMPAVLSEDKKYVGMRPEDQNKLAELALQEATVNGAVDPKILAQVKAPLETANKVSFYRDEDGKLNDNSFGNVFNVLNEKVATSNQQVIAQSTPATPATPATPVPNDARKPAERDAALSAMVQSNIAMRDNIASLKPDASTGQAGVDPVKLKQSMGELNTQIAGIESQLQKVNQNENKIANPSELNPKDRARSDLIMKKTRELEASLAELKAKQALGVKYASALEGGSQGGPGGSSYEMAYKGAAELPGELERLQRDVATKMSEINNLGQPYMPISTSQEGKAMLAHQQGMIKNQIDGLYERRTRIQEQIRELRKDQDNFDKVQALETKLDRVQVEIEERKKVLGDPLYVPSRI